MKTLKTLLIFVLSLLLLAAAVVTRPSEVSFQDYLTGARPRTAPSVTLPRPFPAPLSESDASRFADACTFADRVLWTEVRRDGKTAFVGLFGHWYATPSARASNDPRSPT